uniref:Fas apoptotic inhibitory molecule b n=1 Tax=Oryzias latipes TaxID=8090 RepID=A0A3B3H4N5_ORYLA
MLGGDVVAVWDIALSDGVYRIEFAHGTTTGKRIIYVNGKEVVKKDWMFKLVGKETFTIGSTNIKATINIEAVSGFAYEYSLDIDGKSLQKFVDDRAKTTKTWVFQVDGTDYRVVLEKDTVDVWCNGQKMETRVRHHSEYRKNCQIKILLVCLRLKTKACCCVYRTYMEVLVFHN